ncbi:hypothetical protein CAPTEDRAFT_195598 [Capitella teleta]|uniref:Uncharacterized protein n=1 Tax=Capitella teleta TaxID=283909 RepID=R7UAP1_CAPTE|nr:hypothetical protein CAPTEDRAFT_195598 [Capitella teleta]|eukprot:ELU03201.1 hypothetical protein CAPTEDRAFT_195598 [Capitella teleta]
MDHPQKIPIYCEIKKRWIPLKNFRVSYEPFSSVNSFHLVLALLPSLPDVGSRCTVWLQIHNELISGTRIVLILDAVPTLIDSPNSTALVTSSQERLIEFPKLIEPPSKRRKLIMEENSAMKNSATENSAAKEDSATENSAMKNLVAKEDSVAKPIDLPDDRPHSERPIVFILPPDDAPKSKFDEEKAKREINRLRTPVSRMKKKLAKPENLILKKKTILNSIFNLPSESTLRNIIRDNDIRAGFSESILQRLKTKVVSMEDKQKICSMVLNELAGKLK